MEVLQTCSGKVEEAVRELLHLLRCKALLPTTSPADSEDLAKSKTGESVERQEESCPNPVRMLLNRGNGAV